MTSDDYQQWTQPEAISSSGVLFSPMVTFTIGPKNNVHAVFADNFNGTFHLMYTKLDVSGELPGWTTPVPVAQSIINNGTSRGSVTYPNISVDENSDLYLLYLDGQEPFSSGSLIRCKASFEISSFFVSAPGFDFEAEVHVRGLVLCVMPNESINVIEARKPSPSLRKGG